MMSDSKRKVNTDASSESFRGTTLFVVKIVFTFLLHFFLLPKGTLPVRLEASDMDQMNTLNSNITFRVVSQKPSEPKITLTQIDSRMAHLQLIGCFDYDVGSTTRNFHLLY